MRFDSKVALVTGGSIGFGRAFVRQLAKEGAMVAIADIDLEGGRRTASELTDAGLHAMAIACDVADEEQVKSAVGSVVEQFGGVDLLINNAARHFKKYGKPFSMLSHHDIQELFDVNVMGTINCSLAVRDSMSARGGGVIVNIASQAGHHLRTAYGVSKLAIRGLTVAFAHDFADNAIRVNAVSPGLHATENAVSEYSPEFFQECEIDQLIKRKGTMADIVNAVTFLASEEGSFITGQTLLVNGGRFLQI